MVWISASLRYVPGMFCLPPWGMRSPHASSWPIVQSGGCQSPLIIVTRKLSSASFGFTISMSGWSRRGLFTKRPGGPPRSRSCSVNVPEGVTVGVWQPGTAQLFARMVWTAEKPTPHVLQSVAVGAPEAIQSCRRRVRS